MVGGEIKHIRKRDGRLVKFVPEKITDAVFKAIRATGGDDRSKAEKITRQVVKIVAVVYKGERVPTVEEVQDLVEQMLIESGYADVAKAYILYREHRAAMRETEAVLKDAVNIVDDYIGKLDWRVNENSNMDYSLQGLNNHISSLITSNYWLNKIYTPDIRTAHLHGDIHIHDIGQLSAYCCGWDLKDFLVRGFGGVFGKVESEPPRHFRSALGQVVNFFYTLQGESAGAQAFANFDTLLAPFIRNDNLSEKDVRQALQEFIFNLNIPTRVGFQTPFTNLTMDLAPPKDLAAEAVIIGGKPQETCYGEYQVEMDLINKLFCELMMRGDAKGRIFTFPIPTYNISNNFDWEAENLVPLWEITAKYGVPYFANFINSDMDPSDVRSMCCRLRLDNRVLRKRGGGLFGSNPLTGSIGVVTINMARIGFLCNDEQAYFERLGKLMDTAQASLEIKRKVLEQFTDDNLYPYSKTYLDSVKERAGAYWMNHFSTIGLIGMNESCLNFLGKDIYDEQGKEFAKRVLEFMRDKMLEYQEDTGTLYNLEATPGEATSYRLARLDKEEFPEIKTSGNGEPYYTNSSQLPVGCTDDMFEALEHQDELQALYTGGTVFHGFIGERIEDPQVVKKLVRRIAENYHLPYYTITPTFTICPEHGYIAGEHFECPFMVAEKRDKGTEEQRAKGEVEERA